MKNWLLKSNFTLRDNFWYLRYDFIKWFYFKYHTNETHLNLGVFRKKADLLLLPTPRIFSLTNNCFIKRESLRISRILDRIHSSKVVYIHQEIASRNGDALAIALKNFIGVVILDPTDGEYSARPYWIGSGSKWAAPHIPNPISSSGFCIPLGIPERVNRLNGNADLIQKVPWENKINKILVGPFGLTHASRSLFSSLRFSDLFEVQENKLHPKEYYSLIAKFKFVLCPRGNGIDTHRFWETLYSGSIPIVEKSEWSEYFKSHSIPLLEINSFADLASGSEILDLGGIQEKFSMESIEALSINYWLQQIDKLVLD